VDLPVIERDLVAPDPYRLEGSSGDAADVIAQHA
jgi:hypothetical protein